MDLGVGPRTDDLLQELARQQMELRDLERAVDQARGGTGDITGEAIQAKRMAQEVVGSLTQRHRQLESLARMLLEQQSRTQQQRKALSTWARAQRAQLRRQQREGEPGARSEPSASVDHHVTELAESLAELRQLTQSLAGSVEEVRASLTSEPPQPPPAPPSPIELENLAARAEVDARLNQLKRERRELAAEMRARRAELEQRRQELAAEQAEQRLVDRQTDTDRLAAALHKSTELGETLVETNEQIRVRLDTLAESCARHESTLHSLASATPPASPTPDISAIHERLDEISQRLAVLDRWEATGPTAPAAADAPTDWLAVVEESTAAIREAVAQIPSPDSRRDHEADELSPALDKIQHSIDGLQGAVASLADRLDGLAAGTTTDKATHSAATEKADKAEKEKVQRQLAERQRKTSEQRKILAAWVRAERAEMDAARAALEKERAELRASAADQQAETVDQALRAQADAIGASSAELASLRESLAHSQHSFDELRAAIAEISQRVEEVQSTSATLSASVEQSAQVRPDHSQRQRRTIAAWAREQRAELARQAAEIEKQRAELDAQRATARAAKAEQTATAADNAQEQMRDALAASAKTTETLSASVAVVAQRLDELAAARDAQSAGESAMAQQVVAQAAQQLAIHDERLASLESKLVHTAQLVESLIELHRVRASEPSGEAPGQPADQHAANDAGTKPRAAASSPKPRRKIPVAGDSSWEMQKARLLASVEDGQSANDHAEADDEESEEVSVAGLKAASAEPHLHSSDGLPSEIMELKNTWEEKLRQAEVELSVERARIARKQMELDAKLADVEDQLRKIAATAPAGENPKTSASRFSRFLGGARRQDRDD